MPAASEAQLDLELDRLFQLPLSDFTAARDDLARRLRGEGRREDADRVKQLRKPTVAVWLVNRVAREHELDVKRLTKVGETLAQSHATLAAGNRSGEFAEARREEQRTLEQLARAVRELAAREGVGEGAVPRATETLRAASLSDEGRELLRRARLTEELEPPGFEALAGLSGAAQGQPRGGGAKRERDAARKQARERLRRLQAEERRLAEAARVARREADGAERHAAELRSRADRADADAVAAAEKRAAAEAELERS